jgi:methylase of polypeptide subunit release factors
MSLFYKFQYLVGLTPWERMPSLPIGEQAVALFDREERGKEPPYGRALDLGCGTGFWSVRLAQRGWKVTGVDIVPKAVRTARKRADGAGVQVRFVEGSITHGYRHRRGITAVPGLWCGTWPAARAGAGGKP